VAIAIIHPGARLLAPALDALADVVAGDWTCAARLCAARLRDPSACARDLEVVASRAGVIRSEPEPYRYRLHHRMLLVDEPPALVCAALDLQMMLLMGQWDALELVAPPLGAPVRGWQPLEVLGVRTSHQRPDAWSSLYASRNLVVAPAAARLAHHVLTKLDGRVVRHGYDVPAGPAAVHVG